jgi:hypothetical protein
MRIGDAAWAHAMTAGAVGTVFGALVTLVIGACLYRLALNHAGKGGVSVAIAWVGFGMLLLLPVEFKTSTPGLIILGLAFLSAASTTLGVLAAWVFTFQPNAPDEGIDAQVVNQIAHHLEQIHERLRSDKAERNEATTVKALREYVGEDVTLYVPGGKVRGQLVEVNDWDDRDRPKVELRRDDGSRSVIYCDAIVGYTANY